MPFLRYWLAMSYLIQAAEKENYAQNYFLEERFLIARLFVHSINPPVGFSLRSGW